jgi:hypothetical protein
MNIGLLQDLAISETGFVFDPRTGGTFNVNPTGLCVLRALRDGKAPKAIAEALEQDFEATPSDVLDHVLEFTQLLRQYGLMPDESN